MKLEDWRTPYLGLSETEQQVLVRMRRQSREIAPSTKVIRKASPVKKSTKAQDKERQRDLLLAERLERNLRR